MKNYVKRVILFWFCMVFYMLVQAQVRENRITGHVYDSQNLPLAGVNIKVNAARKSKVDDNTAKMQSIKWLGV